MIGLAGLWKMGYIHFRIDDSDHLYGFWLQLKNRFFREDGTETIERGP